MNDVILNQEAWDRVRAWANGMQTIIKELQKHTSGQPGANPQYSISELVSTLDVIASMLATDLDALSPSWAKEFREEAGPKPRRRQNRKDLLSENGLISDGTEIVVDPRRLPRGADPSAPEFRATFVRGGKKVSWNGEEIALSPLTVRLRDEYGIDANQGNVNGFKYWSLASNPTRTLWEIGEELD